MEEAANGLTWMNDGTDGEDTDGIDGHIDGGIEEEEEENSDDDDDGLVMAGGESTPARKEESWLA